MHTAESSNTVETVPLKKRVAEAQARLDAHTSETVAWHFNPETGCSFLLDYAS